MINSTRHRSDAHHVLTLGYHVHLPVKVKVKLARVHDEQVSDLLLIYLNL